MFLEIHGYAHVIREYLHLLSYLWAPIGTRDVEHTVLLRYSLQYDVGMVEKDAEPLVGTTPFFG